MKQIKSFIVAFRPEADYGYIKLIFQDNTTYELKPLSAEKLNALCNVLKNTQVYWNGTWLSNDKEIFKDKNFII